MLHVDVFEPPEIEQYIGQVVPVTRTTLNISGLADYFWLDHLGNNIQVERKQWGEILNNFDHIEEQLRREIQGCASTHLLIEGTAIPTDVGIDVYRYNGKGYFYRYHRYGTEESPQPTLCIRLHSFLWQLDHNGVGIVHTSTQYETAIALAAMYKQSQRTDCQMFQRYIREKPKLNNQNPHVLTLMGIQGVELGQKKAESLINKFGTVWNVLNQDVASLCTVDGIGKTIATRLLEATGVNERLV